MNGGGESKTGRTPPRETRARSKPRTRQTTLDAFANFRHHADKLARLAAKGGAHEEDGEESGVIPASADALAPADAPPADAPSIATASIKAPVTPAGASVPAWGAEEEIEAEEEWDDNHPLKFWVPGTPSLAPWLGTPGEWIPGIFSEAGVGSADVLCDIGCGDGRIPIMATQMLRCRGSLGIELDGELVEMSVNHAKRRLGDDYEGLGLRFIHGDAMKQDLSAVTVLVVYLLPDSFAILEPLFREFLTGTPTPVGGVPAPERRLVVIGWAPPVFVPTKTIEFGAEETATSSHIHFYDRDSVPGRGDEAAATAAPPAPPSTAIELVYWNIRAIGEPVRLLLHYLGIPFKDTRLQVGPPPGYDKTCWHDTKEELGLDFPNLPYLMEMNVGDDVVCLSQMHAILRYFGEQHHMCGSTPLERARVDMVLEAARDWIYDLFDVTYCTWGDMDDDVHHVKGASQCQKTSPKFEQLKAAYLKPESGRLAMHLARFGNLLQDSEWVAGTREPSIADVVVSEYLDQHLIFEKRCLDGNSLRLAALRRFHERFFGLPSVEKYRASAAFLKEPLHNRYSHFHRGWAE